MKLNIKKIVLIFVLTLIVIPIINAKAVSLSNEKPVWMANKPDNHFSSVASSYRTISDIPTVNIKVPTIVEIPIDLNLNQRKEAVIYDVTDKKFIASYLKSVEANNLINYSVLINGNTQSKLNDYSYTSCTDFDLPLNSTINRASLTFNYDKEISSDNLYLSLDNYVTLPVSLGIKAVVSGAEKIVLAPTKIDSSNISFPKTLSKTWIIDVSYIQPLRICEAAFGQVNMIRNSLYSIRFLAEKDHNYQIYFDADRSVNVSYPEAPNFNNDFGVLKLAPVSGVVNLLFKLSDIDGDGIPDVKDNCVSVPNSDQADIDQNGRGDVCDDYDRDGIINIKDNCPNVPNYNQADTDADGIGDTCDTNEGRITEKYTWLPWVGMGLASIVVIVLFVFTAMSMRKKTKEEAVTDENNS
jgi:hypothetical protein